MLLIYDIVVFLGKIQLLCINFGLELLHCAIKKLLHIFKDFLRSALLHTLEKALELSVANFISLNLTDYLIEALESIFESF